MTIMMLVVLAALYGMASIACKEYPMDSQTEKAQ